MGCQWLSVPWGFTIHNVCYVMCFFFFIIIYFFCVLARVTEKGKAREGEDVMVFYSQVHWPQCRVILIDSDSHFLGDSGRRTQCIWVSACMYCVCISVCLHFALPQSLKVMVAYNISVILSTSLISHTAFAVWTSLSIKYYWNLCTNSFYLWKYLANS